MQRMANVVSAVMHAVLDMADELEEEEEMVGLSVVGGMLVDWTDARKLVVLDDTRVRYDEAGGTEAKVVNTEIHLGLAENLLEKVLGHGCSSKSSSLILNLETFLLPPCLFSL